MAARTENYARVCVAALDAAGSERPLVESSPLSSGDRVVVHLDANIECVALILPLAGSRLVNGWRPQIIGLSEWDERAGPLPPVVWNWDTGAEPFELWVFFFKRDAVRLDEIQKLVNAMQSPSMDEKVLTQQTRKLSEKLGPRMSGKQAIMQGPKAGAPLVGGTVRGTEFPWRDYAHKVNLSDAREGEWVLRHGR